MHTTLCDEFRGTYHKPIQEKRDTFFVTVGQESDRDQHKSVSYQKNVTFTLAILLICTIMVRTSRDNDHSDCTKVVQFGLFPLSLYE